MKKIKIEAELEVFDDVSDLPQEVQQLMQEAFAARDAAYAPYSEFHVGAALLLSNGEIVKGSNQENAAYPSGTGKNKEALNPIPPCGACRQAIAEYEVKQKKPIVIYFMGAAGKVFKSDSLSNLLPFIFTQEYL